MYFQYSSEVKNRAVYVRVVYKDDGKGILSLQYNSTGSDYEATEAIYGSDLADTKGLRIAVFELPFADFRSAQNLEADLRIFSSGDEQMHIFSASLSFDDNFELLTPASTFNMDSRIVSTTVFHWYVPNGGQLTGPWRPVEGRENWTGEPDWWKSQIKQMKAANIDVTWVHLIPTVEHVRVNLFKPLYEMRLEGDDVPRLAPFLDPLRTCHHQ